MCTVAKVDEHDEKDFFRYYMYNVCLAAFLASKETKIKSRFIKLRILFATYQIIAFKVHCVINFFITYHLILIRHNIHVP